MTAEYSYLNTFPAYECFLQPAWQPWDKIQFAARCRFGAHLFRSIDWSIYIAGSPALHIVTKEDVIIALPLTMPGIWWTGLNITDLGSMQKGLHKQQISSSGDLQSAAVHQTACWSLVQQSAISVFCPSTIQMNQLNAIAASVVKRIMFMVKSVCAPDDDGQLLFHLRSSASVLHCILLLLLLLE